MNRKGFVLVETLVVTIFVLMIFSILYSSIVPLLGRYQELSYYDDLDTTYDVYQYRKLLEQDANLTNNESRLYQIINSDSAGYGIITCADFDNILQCDQLDDYLNKSNNDTLLYLNTNKLSNLKSDIYIYNNLSNEIKDYLNYINLTNKKILLFEHNGYISYVELGTIEHSEINTIKIKYDINISDSKEIDTDTLSNFSQSYNVNHEENINIQIPSFGDSFGQVKICRKSIKSYATDGTELDEQFHGYELLGLSENKTDTMATYQFGDTINNVTTNKTLYAIWNNLYAQGNCRETMIIRESASESSNPIGSISSNQSIVFLTSAYAWNTIEKSIWYYVSYNGISGYIKNGQGSVKSSVRLNDTNYNAGRGSCHIISYPKTNSCS